MTWQTSSTNSSVTEHIAETIGLNLKGGEVIELVSDLGGGKTTFVRGLARGMGSSDRVSSPTFKISNEYQGKYFKLYHFDFYRLPEAGLVADELAEIIGEPQNVTVVEWADIVQNVLPRKRLTIVFTNKGENDRGVAFTYPKSLAYLMKGSI